MKRTGYQPHFAAAVEAAASTGGQIMPPIMGAAAFLMAELTGTPYPVIAVAAILPAILYFTGIFVMVHFEAKKNGLKGLAREDIPHFGKLLITKGFLFLPIVVLVSMMTFGFTPAFSAVFALISVFLLSFIQKETRFTPAKLADALAGGSRNTIGVAVACGIAGIIVGVVSLTGIGQRLIGALMLVVYNPIFVSTGTSLIAALFLTMITCIILGMGVPTTANYVIMATITAPMVIRTGTALGTVIPILAAHMFVFYFGIIADITPPVALAAYAGSAIAKSNPIKTGVTATKLAIAAFIIPYIFIFSPEMLWIGATPLKVIQIIFSSLTGMFILSTGTQGFMVRKVSPPLRILAIVGGLALIHPGTLTDVIGLAVSALLILTQVMIVKREK
jgi:TRAP transporter 4TM/12TM fusion protein